MEKFILTSKSFDGQVLFGYEEDRIVYYLDESTMSEAQYRWLWRHFPFTYAELEAIKRTISGKLEAVKEEVTFESFWLEYGKKINRKRCEQLWAKMSEPKRIKAIKGIKSYNNFLIRNQGRGRLDPENWLKREAYLNDWNAA